MTFEDEVCLFVICLGELEGGFCETSPSYMSRKIVLPSGVYGFFSD